MCMHKCQFFRMIVQVVFCLSRSSNFCLLLFAFSHSKECNLLQKFVAYMCKGLQVLCLFMSLMESCWTQPVALLAVGSQIIRMREELSLQCLRKKSRNRLIVILKAALFFWSFLKGAGLPWHSTYMNSLPNQINILGYAPELIPNYSFLWRAHLSEYLSQISAFPRLGI